MTFSRLRISPAAIALLSATAAFAGPVACDQGEPDDPATTSDSTHDLKTRSGVCSPLSEQEENDFSSDSNDPSELGILCQGVNVISGELFDADTRDSLSLNLLSGQIVAMELVVSEHQDSPGGSTRVGVDLRVDGQPREEASIDGDGTLVLPTPASPLSLPSGPGNYNFNIQHVGQLPEAASNWELRITVADCPFVRSENGDFGASVDAATPLGTLCTGVNVISGELFDTDTRDWLAVNLASGEISAMELVVSNHQDSPGGTTSVGVAIRANGSWVEEASTPGDGTFTLPTANSPLELPAGSGLYEFGIQHVGRLPDASSDWMLRITVDPGDPICDADLQLCAENLATGEEALAESSADLATCQQDHLATDAQLSECTSTLSAVSEQLGEVQADEDGDGVADNHDDCPQTIAEEAVDLAGCSQEQFCVNLDITIPQGKKICRKSDWNNDEPLGASDCAVANKACTVAAPEAPEDGGESDE